MNTGHRHDIKLWLVFLLLIYSAIKRNEPSPHTITWMNFTCIFLSERIQSEKAAHWVTRFVGDSGKGKTRDDIRIWEWIPWYFHYLYLPLCICQNPELLGHLAGSVSGACNSWSWGPHVGCGDYLKVKSLKNTNISTSQRVNNNLLKVSCLGCGSVTGWCGGQGQAAPNLPLWHTDHFK